MTLKGMGIGTVITFVGLLIPSFFAQTEFNVGVSLLLIFFGVVFWFLNFE
jgi:hypothetical protein